MQQDLPHFPMASSDFGSTGLPITPSPPDKSSSQEEAQPHWGSVPASIYPTYVIQESDAITPAMSITDAPGFLQTDNLTPFNSAEIMIAQNLLDSQPFGFEPTIFNMPSPTSEPMPAVIDTMLKKL
jgi:hypothetical protein